MSAGDKALDRSRAVRRVLGGLVVANIAVLVAKAVYNVLGLVVVRVAAHAPDEDHPYGHGKFETLGADAVEERLKKDLELEEVTVHVEPC